MLLLPEQRQCIHCNCFYWNRSSCVYWHHPHYVDIIRIALIKNNRMNYDTENVQRPLFMDMCCVSQNFTEIYNEKQQQRQIFIFLPFILFRTSEYYINIFRGRWINAIVIFMLYRMVGIIFPCAKHSRVAYHIFRICVLGPFLSSTLSVRIYNHT